jgi:hypothetical protein
MATSAPSLNPSPHGGGKLIWSADAGHEIPAFAGMTLREKGLLNIHFLHKLRILLNELEAEFGFAAH